MCLPFTPSNTENALYLSIIPLLAFLFLSHLAHIPHDLFYLPFFAPKIGRLSDSRRLRLSLPTGQLFGQPFSRVKSPLGSTKRSAPERNWCA